MPKVLAFREPSCPETDGGLSAVSVLIESGAPITLWSGATTSAETAAQTTLQLERNQHVVIGRQQGGEIEYLDPRFRPTRIVPATGQLILKQHASDDWVSRGHFMLRAGAQGLVLVNGVPRRGGGLRPPMNGTRMLAPHDRNMNAGEEFVIERGTMA